MPPPPILAIDNKIDEINDLNHHCYMGMGGFDHSLMPLVRPPMRRDRRGLDLNRANKQRDTNRLLVDSLVIAYKHIPLYYFRYACPMM